MTPCWHLSPPWLFELTPKSKSLETSSNQSFFFIDIYKTPDSFLVHLQIATAFQTAHLLLKPWFRFLIRGSPWQRRERRGWRRGRGKRKDPYRCSPPDNEFSPPFKCICRMLEWFITADPEVWQWTSEMSDAIFLLISFPWSSLSPWPVYLY